MSDRKTLAVFGATGTQGGGLAEAALADGAFAVRALTRKPDSERARALAAAGAEVVRADADDPASLAPALDGADAVFCVTNFWEHFSPERELAQAGAMARAAKEAGVGHVVWSTLEDTRRLVPLDDDRMPTLMGRYKVPHFDAKGEADGLFREAGLPATFLLTSFYWDNLLGGLRLQPRPDGALALVLPMGDAKLPGIAGGDIGRCAYGVVRRPELIGRTVGIAGEHLTGDEMAATLAAALGRPVRYEAVDPAVFRGFGFPGADDLGNMFQFKRDFTDAFRAPRDVGFARTLYPGLRTFGQWLAEHADRIAAA